MLSLKVNLKFSDSRLPKDDHSEKLAPTHLVGGGQDLLDMAGPFLAISKMEKFPNTSEVERCEYSSHEPEVREPKPATAYWDLGGAEQEEAFTPPAEADRFPVSEEAERSQEIRAQVKTPAAHNTKIMTKVSDADIRVGQKENAIISPTDEFPVSGPAIGQAAGWNVSDMKTEHSRPCPSELIEPDEPDVVHTSLVEEGSVETQSLRNFEDKREDDIY